MKKLFLALLLLPVLSYGAVTNKLDNILNTTSFQRPAGAAAGNLWTSDAAGFGSWVVPGAASGPFAITNGPNFFTAASTNIWASDYNRMSGVLAISNSSPNNKSAIFLDPGKGTTATADDRGASFMMMASNGVMNLNIVVLPASMNMRGSYLNGRFIHDDSAGNVTFGADYLNAIIGGGANNIQIGTGASASLTINAVTWTAANGFNLNAGQLQAATSSSVLTNVTGFTSVGTVTASNYVATTAGSTVTSANLGFSNQLLFAQVQTNTFAAANTATNDYIIPRFPVNLPMDSIWTMRVTSANVVSVFREGLSSPVENYTNTFSFLRIKTQ